MSFPAVGVVVTACDYGRYLAECLRSLDVQELPIDELVVVDDASNDETEHVLQRELSSLEIGNRTRILRHGKRTGLAESLNDGVAALSAPWVAHVDADDTVEASYTHALATALAGNPQAGYAYPRLRLFGNETGVMSSYPFDPGRLVFEGNYIPNVAMMRRQIFLRVGGMRSLPTHVDWDLWLRFLSEGWPGVLVDEPLYNWRRHATAMTYQPRFRRLEARARISLRHRKLLWRHRRDAPVWTSSAIRRRLPGHDGPARLGPSGWVDNE